MLIDAEVPRRGLGQLCEGRSGEYKNDDDRETFHITSHGQADFL